MMLAVYQYTQSGNKHHFASLFLRRTQVVRLRLGRNQTIESRVFRSISEFTSAGAITQFKLEIIYE